jgi:HEAT repeat protein
MQALMTLAAIGEAAKPAAPQIIEKLERDDFGGVRYAAAFALGKINAGTASDPALKRSMESDDPMLAMISAWALAKAHPDDAQIAEKASALIVNGLKSEDPQVQSAAARALADSNLSSEFTAPALEEALEKASPQVVAHAMQAFAALGERAVPRVVRGLQSEKLRKYAAQILAQIGPDATAAVPALIETLKTADPETRREVHFALAAIGPGAGAAVPSLLESLKSEDDDIKYSATYALGKIGEQAKDAYPELMKIMNSEEEFPRIAAVWAMTRIDPGRPEVVTAAVPLLTRALQSDRDLVRTEAAATLGEIGAPAKAALPALKQALNDRSAAVQDAARQAIQRIEGGKKR